MLFRSTHDELEEDPECIGNCFLKSDKPEKVEKGYVFTYQFNDQDYKLKKDSSVYNAHQNLSLGSITDIIEDSPNKNIVKIECKYGTEGYMASEQYSYWVGYKSDIYSIGVVLVCNLQSTICEMAFRMERDEYRRDSPSSIYHLDFGGIEKPSSMI